MLRHRLFYAHRSPYQALFRYLITILTKSHHKNLWQMRRYEEISADKSARETAGEELAGITKTDGLTLFLQ
jgi:hypothetical protein